MHRAFTASVALVLAAVCDGALFGAYIDNETYASSFDMWLAKSPSLRHINIGWGNASTPAQIFLTQVQPVWEAGHVPFIDWMPFPYLTWTNPSPNEDIVNGKYDGYISGFLGAAKDFLAGPDAKWNTSDDRRLYVRFAFEPNGNWFPWSPNCPPCGSNGQKIDQSIASYLSLWKYVTNWVRGPAPAFDLDALHLQWVWGANNEDAYGAGWKIEDFFPGDEFVDWVSIDGYNWGNTLPGHQWQEPAEVYGPAIARVRTLSPTKPLGVGVFACTSVPNGLAAKDKWLNSSFAYFHDADVRLFTYFNIDNDHDWAVFASSNGTGTWTAGNGQVYNVFGLFKTAIDGSDWILGSNSSNPRLLDDEQFQWGNSSMMATANVTVN